MSAHTTGRWVTIGPVVYCKAGLSELHPIAQMLATPSKDGKEALANAALMAEAPQMLHLLRQWRITGTTPDLVRHVDELFSTLKVST